MVFQKKNASNDGATVVPVKVKKVKDPNAPPKPKSTRIAKRNIASLVAHLRKQRAEKNQGAKITFGGSLNSHIASLANTYMLVLLKKFANATHKLKQGNVISINTIRAADLSTAVAETSREHGLIPIVKKERDPTKVRPPIPIISRKKFEEFIKSNPSMNAQQFLDSLATTATTVTA